MHMNPGPSNVKSAQQPIKDTNPANLEAHFKNQKWAWDKYRHD